MSRTSAVAVNDGRGSVTGAAPDEPSGERRITGAPDPSSSRITASGGVRSLSGTRMRAARRSNNAASAPPP